jgi:hypothetical protein
LPDVKFSPGRLKDASVPVLAAMVAVLVVAATGADAARSPSSAGTRCDRPFTSTLLETSRIRVYAMA